MSSADGSAALPPDLLNRPRRRPWPIAGVAFPTAALAGSSTAIVSTHRRQLLVGEHCLLEDFGPLVLRDPSQVAVHLVELFGKPPPLSPGLVDELQGPTDLPAPQDGHLHHTASDRAADPPPLAVAVLSLVHRRSCYDDGANEQRGRFPVRARGAGQSPYHHGADLAE